MDMSDAELDQIPDHDRREVDPPIPVETATWSHAGQSDWWVKERRPRLQWCVVRTVSNAGSRLLIFALRIAHGPKAGSYRLLRE
jgi:hypothetical protein